MFGEYIQYLTKKFLVLQVQKYLVYLFCLKPWMTKRDN